MTPHIFFYICIYFVFSLQIDYYIYYNIYNNLHPTAAQCLFVLSPIFLLDVIDR